MPNFINPYNFIPLTGKHEKIKSKEKLSGVITYTVLTKTPLFIPNTSNNKAFEVKFESDAKDDDKKEHRAYDFFSYDNLVVDKDEKDRKFFNEEYHEPVIPGSEIRGMLRSNYEILTNSCLSVIDDDVALSKRTNQVFHAGLLKKTPQGYELYKAVDCLWRTKGEYDTTDETDWKKEYYTRKCYRQSAFTEGEKVYFRYVKRPLEQGGEAKPLAFEVSKTKTEISTEEGYVIFGEEGPEMEPNRDGISAQKHCAHIFKKIDGKSIQLLSDLSILEKVIAEYQDERKPDADPNRYKRYADELKVFQEGKVETYFPVYYDLVKDAQKKTIIFLSPASKTREIYQNKISDMLGGYKACDDKGNLCPACSLFGTIGGEGKEKFAVASKLRFADLAVSTKKDNCKEYYENIVTIPELSSPKLTNMEFYMKKPADDAVFWTYGYYIDNSGTVHVLEHPEINGRKFYWHNLDMRFNSAEPNKRNMTIRPLKKDITFTGKLYFDRITEKELHSLIWILNAGETCERFEDAAHGYKLGTAKPLGLGSIAVHVESVMLRSVDKKEDTIEYKEEAYTYYLDELNKDGSTLFDDIDTIDHFRKMTDFKAVPANRISYPIPDGVNDAEGFKWFAEENHKAYSRKKDGSVSTNKSPNKRTQEFFGWYMEPMKEELLETKNPLKHQKLVNKAGNQHGHSSNGPSRKAGEEYIGKVTRYNGPKTRAIVQLNDGSEVSLFFKEIKGKYVEYGKIDQVLKKNSMVTLVYKGKRMGKDNQEHDQWECIRFEK